MNNYKNHKRQQQRNPMPRNIDQKKQHQLQKQHQCENDFLQFAHWWFMIMQKYQYA